MGLDLTFPHTKHSEKAQGTPPPPHQSDRSECHRCPAIQTRTERTEPRFYTTTHHHQIEENHPHPLPSSPAATRVHPSICIYSGRGHPASHLTIEHRFEIGQRGAEWGGELSVSLRFVRYWQRRDNRDGIHVLLIRRPLNSSL